MSENKIVNYADEILAEMKTQEVDPVVINFLKNNSRFQESYHKPPAVQRVMVVSAVYRLMLKLKVFLPKEVRLALNTDMDDRDWIMSMKLAIIPFIKVNSLTFIEENKNG